MHGDYMHNQVASYRSFQQLAISIYLLMFNLLLFLFKQFHIVCPALVLESVVAIQNKIVIVIPGCACTCHAVAKSYSF